MVYENYATLLDTPHPIRALGQDEPSQRLASVISNQGFGEQLASIGDQAEREENALAVAHVVCSQVREALWYPERREDFKLLDIEEPISLADLPEKQAGDCFAFTVVASECLEIAGIDHWIGFANGHATIILPTEEGNQLNLADPLSPVLSQNLKHSMVRGGSKGRSVNDDMDEFGRSAIELNTFSLADRARGDTADPLAEHRWLIFRRGFGAEPIGSQAVAQAMVEGADLYGQAPHPSRARIFMSLFTPEEGRHMLHDYDDFQQAYHTEDYLGAAASIYKMRDGYPDVDARQSHSRFKAVLRHLAGDGNVNYARKLIEAYFGGFELMADDSRVPEAHADCLAIVAREAGDPESAGEAAELYRTVLRYDKAYKEAVAGKLSKVTSLMARLYLGPLPNA